ncbi:hypothetical protein [Variovorax sp. E3]|uniref:hypothetical protein n=1 Tax=Variovorax sp. E3 TaxID=1914993 RepID=UPI0018DB00BE|nr:hypothetical protein [Variovorax sp. E3]
MRALKAGWLLLAAVCGTGFAPTVAANGAFTRVFEGTGRACSGNLYIRARTAEWNTPFSVCRPSRYEVLEKDLAREKKRLAIRLETRGRHCRYEVIEVEKVSRYGWNANGYPSVEAFDKRALPDWENSALPERMTLSCPVIER